MRTIVEVQIFQNQSRNSPAMVDIPMDILSLLFSASFLCVLDCWLYDGTFMTI